MSRLCSTPRPGGGKADARLNVDDVVFVVLIAQMFLYRTDYSRSNEYGQKLEADPLTPAAAAAAAVEGQVVESKKDI